MLCQASVPEEEEWRSKQRGSNNNGPWHPSWSRREGRPKGAAAAKSLQSCLTLCDPIDSSPPGSSVPGILQARLLEWVPFPSPMHACMLSHSSCVRLCATSWTAAHQAPLSTGFSRQGYWSGLPFPSLKRGLMDDKDMTERVHCQWGPTIITLFLIVRIFNGPKRKSVYCPTLNEGSIRSGRMFDFLFAVF